MLNSEFIPEYLKSFSTEELLKPVFLIQKELHEVGEADFPAAFADAVFIHAAASVNLANSKAVFQEIEFNNFDGTLSVLMKSLPFLKKFVYISTAYATGHRNGLIGNDFLSFDGCSFRNPYESFKNKTEKSVVGICEKNSVDWQILRPSIICGRTLDQPLFFTPRFPVFYLIGKYFYLLKKCSLYNPHIRIYAPENSGLNIVPVDYVARAIVRLIFQEYKQVNLVHSSHFNISDLFRIGLQEINYEHFTLVSEPIANPHISERRYENVINSQLQPYLETPAHDFDSGIIREIMSDFPEPDIYLHFSGLIRFAIGQHFKAIY